MLIESKRFCLHAPGLELKLLYHFIGQQNSYIEIFWFICYFCCYAASMNSNYTNLTYLWFALTFDVEDGTSALSWEGGDAMDDLFFPISDLYDSIFLFDQPPLADCLHSAATPSTLIFCIWVSKDSESLDFVWQQIESTSQGNKVTLIDEIFQFEKSVVIGCVSWDWFLLIFCGGKADFDFILIRQHSILFWVNLQILVLNSFSFVVKIMSAGQYKIFRDENTSTSAYHAKVRSPDNGNDIFMQFGFHLIFLDLIEFLASNLYLSCVMIL